jgi:general secretion pathway protein C
VRYLPLVAAVALFSAACASAAYWGLQWFRPQQQPVAAAPHAGPAPLAIEAAAGLFGGAQAGAAVASAYQLKGVIEAGPEGVAILAADGKPARAVRVDTEVAPGVRLTEVHQRYALLNEGGVIKRLALPENGIGGLEPVAAAAPSDAPAAATPPRAAPKVYRSGEAMPPPVIEADARKVSDEMQDHHLRQQTEHMRYMEQMQRMHPSGVGSAALAARPPG